MLITDLAPQSQATLNQPQAADSKLSLKFNDTNLLMVQSSVSELSLCLCSRVERNSRHSLDR